MDLYTSVVYVGVVVISAVVILLVSMFGIKEKSYEEAIAEQRKLPEDNLLMGKKEKGKEKKHKNKTGKKVKEKKEEKDEKEEKIDHPSAVHFEETPVVLPLEPATTEVGKGAKKKSKIEKVKPILVNKDDPSMILTESTESPEIPVTEVNHFDRIQPKDSLELFRSHSKEALSLQQTAQSEPMINKSPKETPTRTKKSVKEPVAKKKEETKEEKSKDAITVSASAPQQQVTKETPKEPKEMPKEVKETKETKEFAVPQLAGKETKKGKKKNDILAQIGGDRDGINVSLLMPLVQKAELSRSEIQILIDQLLNKQQDNPSEHSEWTEGRTDPVIKLKKQLAEKDKALADEHEASATFQNKLKELRVELNAERSRLTTTVKQLEEALNSKITEAQTLHTRMQHILESHAAEKQGFARQIEQLQSKVNEDAAIIHKMQEDQGQTQGHMQQELIAQRKQLEVQFSQMRENENSLKAQLAQKHIEVQDLQTGNINITQELQATVESSNAEIEMLRQQLVIMQEQCMHSEGQLQHFKEAAERMHEMGRQAEETLRAHADFEHRLKNAHRHEQELQKQVHALQAELKMAKSEANETSGLKSELNKVQNELMKMKSDLSQSQNEAKSEAAEITSLRATINERDEKLKYYTSEMAKLSSVLRELVKAQDDLRQQRGDFENIVEQLTKATSKIQKLEIELANATANEAAKIERESLQNGGGKTSEVQLQITRLQEENDRLSAQLAKYAELQKELKQLREDNESLSSQLAATTERPAAEGRENGVEEKAQKNSVQLLEHTNLLEQKESQIEALKIEITSKESELVKLRAQVESLQSELTKQSNAVERLQNELEAQRSKNNELRTKNWKVMEALTAAESRVKTDTGKSIDESAEKIKFEEHESTKSLLQRIFPEVDVSEKSYERWLEAFEARVNVVLTELRERGSNDGSNELEKQNKTLQGLVSHYQQIIDDTESMLNKLQSQIETEESRWKSQLLQKENEVSNLRIELKEFQNQKTFNEKLANPHETLDSLVYDSDGVEFAFSCIEKSLPTITRELQQKITELEGRLAEEESLREESKAEILALRDANKKGVKGAPSNDFLGNEQQHEEQNKRSNADERLGVGSIDVPQDSILRNAKNLVSHTHMASHMQNEVSRLNTEICGGSSISDQSTANGPATSDSSKSEPTRATETLIAALEKTLPMYGEPEKKSVSEKSVTVQSQHRDNDSSSLESDINSKYCHTTENNTQGSWNPLNGQQHKKHKKKRKGGSGKK